MNLRNRPENDLVSARFRAVRPSVVLRKIAVRLALALLVASVLLPILHPHTVKAACELCATPFADLTLLRQWQPLDVAIVTSEWPANPYDASALDVELLLIAPSGRRVRVPTFPSPEGKRELRARITFTEPGRWSAVAQMRQPRRASGPPVRWLVKAPAEDAPAAGARGFVRVNRLNRAMLAFDNGEPFFPIGANIGWYTNDALIEFERRFDALAANGGTVARVWLAPWSFLPEWKDTGLRNYANRELRMGWFDRILAMAEARGIYLIVVLSESGMFVPDARWPENPYNIANGGPCAEPRDFLTDARAKAAYRNQLRYIAARWGSSPNILAWEWMNEVNSAPGFETAELMPWLVEMTSALRAYDVNRHLTTISYAAVDGDPGVWAMREIDLVQRHEYIQSDPAWFRPIRDAQGALARFKQVREQPVKPVIVGEFGANSDIEHPRGGYRQGIHLHNSLWASAFAGMAGSAQYWWWDNYIEPGDLWTHYRGLSSFLRGEDLSRMVPAAVTATVSAGNPVVAQALATPPAAVGRFRALLWLRNADYRHDSAVLRAALERSAGESDDQTFRFVPAPSQGVVVTLAGLPAGRYTIDVYDTATGAVLDRQTAKTGTDGVVSWKIQSIGQDIAMKIAYSGL